MPRSVITAAWPAVPFAFEGPPKYRKNDGLQHKGEGMPFLPFRMVHTVMAQDMLTHRYTTKNIT